MQCVLEFDQRVLPSIIRQTVILFPVLARGNTDDADYQLYFIVPFQKLKIDGNRPTG